MDSCPGNTPVLVGVAAVQQKLADHRAALEPLDLMEQALRNAAADAGSVELLALADEILVPNSLWGYSDPARLLAQRLRSDAATTLLAEFGILQQSLLDRACQRIRDNTARVVLVTGGEARFRSQCAARAGEEATEVAQPDAVPDVVLRPEAEMMSDVESAAGLGMPVGYYAIMDSALRYRQGLSVQEHRDQMAHMYAGLSELAAANPDAWSTEVVSPEFVREHSAGNRMLAFPYTKLHNSQWNVDQAAGLIFCSAEMATSLGIPREQWVFPVASTESNFMAVISSRAELGASEGFRIAGRRAMELAGVDFNEVPLRELYSCFPYAIRVQQEEFGLAPAADVSVTGGMTFAGGPLNNFVFQATVKMAQLLREQRAEMGLVTTVSGLMTKQACCLWSSHPPQGGWVFEDVTNAVREATAVRELVATYAGEATVAGYTVLYNGMQASRAIAVFDLPDGRRSVAYSEDPLVVERMLGEECCGTRFQLHDGRFS